MHYGVELLLMRRPFKAVKRELLDEFERRYLVQLLEQHACDLSAVSRSSGWSRRQVFALIRKHNEFLHSRTWFVMDPRWNEEL